MKSLTKVALVVMVALVMGLCFSTTAQAQTITIGGSGSFLYPNFPGAPTFSDGKFTITGTGSGSLLSANGQFTITGDCNGGGTFWIADGVVSVKGSATRTYISPSGAELVGTLSVEGSGPANKPISLTVTYSFNGLSYPGSGTATVTYVATD